MPRFYAEICVFIEAGSLLDAEDIARQASERADLVSGVSSTSVNAVDEQDEVEEDERDTRGRYFDSSDIIEEG